MQQGTQVMAKRMELMRQNLPKYIVSWVGEAIAYWIFVIIAIDSPFGFNWWLGNKAHNFGIICIIYLLKNVGLLILVPIQHKRLKAFFADARFPWIDIAYFCTHIVFWLVSIIYAFDRESTQDKRRNIDWIKRYQKWNDEIYILPVVKLCVDFVYAVVATLMQPMSHTALSGGAIIWMDLQYLFIYLFISGKNRWANYFIVFVWIYMGSIIATLAALCIICFLVLAIFKRQPGMNATQYVIFVSLAVMIILFFVFANIIGAASDNQFRDYKKDNIYILLVCVILYTLFNGFQTFALWKGVQLMPQQSAAF